MSGSSTPHHNMSALEWGMLIALSLLWGGSFFFNGIAVRELPPLTIVVSRIALAAMALFIVMRVLRLEMPKNPEVWLAFFIMGLLNNALPFTLIVWGQIHIASGVASILNATTPLFTVLVAHMLTTDEKLTLPRLCGVVLGLLGVVILIGGDVIQTIGNNLLAQLAVLAGAISYAFAGVYGRRFKSMGVPPIATATGQVTASSILLLPLMLYIDQPWTLPLPSPEALAALVGIALLSTALAYILYFQILARAGATNLLLVTFLIPVSAILLGVLFLGEVILAKHLIGMTFIGGGLAAIDGRITHRLRRGLTTGPGPQDS
ncbi:DMT family transporter [Kiloniella laminariae]|uniref:DMT family transporter n=1 Tax=Kiloniella laminariae TaxID=454162 RepID=A0ABT4LN37_9PROT|nr:DMT family transporter [Kiloniella laminariae]MCZ4282300.1 DMT family transporter [Kiloniella laminariae]